MAAESPLDLLSLEMRDEDTEVRYSAMQRLKVVAKALGPDRAREELVPFLNDLTEDNDEVLLELAKQLGQFIDLIGGKDYGVRLLPLLEALCGVEETVVRDEAVKSSCNVIKVLDPAIVNDSVIHMIQRLSKGDWFTSRVSACGLFADTYPHIPSAASRSTLREVYAELCRDLTPMVRRSAAKHLGTLAKVIEPEHVVGEMVQLLKDLCDEQQEATVQLIALENCTEFAELLSVTENEEFILPLIRRSAGCEKSWRRRLLAVNCMSKIAKSLGADLTRAQLLIAYKELLSDSEAEVRAAALTDANLIIMSEHCGQQLFSQHLLPPIRERCQDPMPNVRVACCKSVMGAAAAFGPTFTREFFIPLINNDFICDESPQVRLTVMQNLSGLVKTLSPASLVEFCKVTIEHLANDAYWRVRSLLVRCIPLMAEKMEQEIFDTHLLPIVQRCFIDQINSVRIATNETFADLTAVFGAEWCISSIGSHIVDTYGSAAEETGPNYQSRMSMLHAIEAIVKKNPSEEIGSFFHNIVANGLMDDVVNVQLVACKVAPAITPVLNGKALDDIKNSLSELTRHTDPDVSFFASQGLEKMM
eukprot:TRINITY_DN774226_c0_g1_i1.p1 TRINITY_DN774226_c0_g1~~TRINITY_DN774226_c0_g1_i1.p1  ORF type:complete len:589 (+),score=208.68 TRINITY_DN774226_c0_g1_i1:93-1859(+)